MKLWMGKAQHSITASVEVVDFCFASDFLVKAGQKEREMCLSISAALNMRSRCAHQNFT